MTEREKDLVTLPQNTVELTIAQTKKQVDKIQSLIRSVMKDNVHYGTVPGIKNKFLYKAGAEKLCLVFRLIPEYKIERFTHEPIHGIPGHLTYNITCRLIHQPSGAFMGQGVGSGSTLEKKYRYRNEDLPTDVELPSAWWNMKKAENLSKILKNNGVEPKTEAALKKAGLEIAPGKVNGKWQIVYRKKVENADVADVYNTVLKMTKKRALVDATITALAVSDMFTQDIEVVEEEEEAEDKTDNNTKKSTTRKGTGSRRRTVNKADSTVESKERSNG
jgi:hypothetical protein